MNWERQRTGDQKQGLIAGLLYPGGVITLWYNLVSSVLAAEPGNCSAGHNA
ncbi:MAG: hypothetical protein OXC27_12185 [Caldilineaceae bacterium]|nr:hypothetical protein [Caldilineaceae bacterium]